MYIYYAVIHNLYKPVETAIIAQCTGAAIENKSEVM